MITSGSIKIVPSEKETQKNIFGFELNKPLIDKKDFLLKTSEQMDHTNNTNYANQIPSIKQSLIGPTNNTNCG